MATEHYLNEYKQIFEQWKNINLKAVYREELGTASFNISKTIIDDITSKNSRLDTVKEKLGDSILQQYNNPVSQILAQLKVISSYKEATFITQKQNIFENIKANYEKILNIWPQIVAIINDEDKSESIENTIIQINKLKEKTQEDSKNIEQLKIKLEEDLKTFDERYKNEILNKAELIKQEDAYSKDATIFEEQAKCWLYGIIASSVVLLLVLSIIFKFICFELNCFDNVCNVDYDQICKDCNRIVLYFEIIKSVTFRLFVISFFSYLINICVKNYNASMHNYTVNKHKANSISAALVLLDKAKTDEGNDQIMTQAITAIFSHQPTGYNEKKPENTSSSIVEKIIDKAK